MTYTAEHVEEMRAERLAIQWRFLELREAFAFRPYQNDQAKEHAQHGFGVRVATLVHCINRVFAILAPDRRDIPEKAELLDVTVNIQAFVSNVFGCLENLSWIWVCERNVTRTDGQPLARKQVGLGDRYPIVWESLTPGLQVDLQTRRAWFDNLKNFRDSLSHRIPLFIPPFIVAERDVPRYNELEAALDQAILDRDFDRSKALQAEKMTLVHFKPVMTHSFYEQAEVVWFHQQLLSDFKMIDEIGSKLLEELGL
jgi:hypothetical protein